jgi:hypothetical protein
MIKTTMMVVNQTMRLNKITRRMIRKMRILSDQKGARELQTRVTLDL